MLIGNFLFASINGKRFILNYSQEQKVFYTENEEMILWVVLGERVKTYVFFIS